MMFDKFQNLFGKTVYIAIVQLYNMEKIISVPFVVFKSPTGSNWYIASCPVLDISTQGKTYEEAVKNIREAIELYMEDEHTEKPTQESLESLRAGFLTAKVRGVDYHKTKAVA